MKATTIILTIAMVVCISTTTACKKENTNVNELNQAYFPDRIELLSDEEGGGIIGSSNRWYIHYNNDNKIEEIIGYNIYSIIYDNDLVHKVDVFNTLTSRTTTHNFDYDSNGIITHYSIDTEGSIFEAPEQIDVTLTFSEANNRYTLVTETEYYTTTNIYTFDANDNFERYEGSYVAEAVNTNDNNGLFKEIEPQKALIFVLGPQFASYFQYFSQHSISQYIENGNIYTLSSVLDSNNNIVSFTENDSDGLPSIAYQVDYELRNR